MCAVLSGLAPAAGQMLVFGASGGVAPTANQSTWCQAHACAPAHTYHLVVGESVSFNMTASSTLANRNFTLAVLSDPGLPSGCHVTAAEEYPVASGIKAHLKRFSFTPTPGQEGIVYKVCVKATDLQNTTHTATHCIHLDVAAPVVAFKTGSTLTREFSVGVNCPV